MSVSLASFHDSGYIPVKGETMDSSARGNILDEMLSGPLDFAGLRLRIWVIISSLVKGMQIFCQ